MNSELNESELVEQLAIWDGYQLPLLPRAQMKYAARARTLLRLTKSKVAETVTEAERAVIEAARLFLKEGTRVTQRGDGYFFQQVIEKKDKSDPHYKLCVAVEALDEAMRSSSPVEVEGRK